MRPQSGNHQLNCNLRTRIAGMAFALWLCAAISVEAQTYQLLHGFTDFGGDTYEPLSGLTIDAGGNLYGTTYFDGDHGLGSGSVFRLSRKGTGWIYTPLHVFHFSTTDGADPGARVIFGPDGSLYGSTVSGGAYGFGTVFQLRPSVRACQTALCPWTLDLLYSFNNYDGCSPNEIAFDRSGNIYGTTEQCGPNSEGTLYELVHSGGSWTFQLLHAFDASTGYPLTGVVTDQGGNLYGTTASTVYEYTTSAQFEVLHKFSNNEGIGIYSGMVLDQAGNLYVQASNGGADGGGAVSQLSPSADGWTLNTLYSFSSGGLCDGVLGSSDLSMDAAGNLYGTTFCKGAYGYGNVFKLSPSNGGWNYTSLYDFCSGGYPCSDGERPFTNVVLDSKGNLYGAVAEGVNSNDPLGGGGVWQIAP